MGPCIVKEQNKLTDPLPDKALKYLDENQLLHKKFSQLSTATNPEELLKKISDDVNKKREEIPTAPSEAKLSQHPDSFITLSQLLASQNQADSNELEKINYQSSIIKLPKRENRISQGQQSTDKMKMRSVLMSEVYKQQILDGKKSGIDESSRLLIRLEKMDFEFILPQLRAGPLIVPLINYSSYEV